MIQKQKQKEKKSNVVRSLAVLGPGHTCMLCNLRHLAATTSPNPVGPLAIAALHVLEPAITAPNLTRPRAQRKIAVTADGSKQTGVNIQQHRPVPFELLKANDRQQVAGSKE